MFKVVLDIETTGLDIYKDQIIEIGLVFLDGYSEVRTEHKYFNPTVPINPAAEKVHGLSKNFLSKFAEFDPQWIISMVGSYPLIIHNANFDLKLINYQLKLKKYPELINQVIDTLQIARTKFPGSPANLDALCSKFKIENKNRKFHSALIDAQLTAKVYANLFNYGCKPLSFGTEKMQNRNKINNIQVKISEEEHKNYLILLSSINNS